MKASKKIRIGLSILLIVLLLGCRSRNITKDYSFDDAKGKGVIIASLTISGESGLAMMVNLRGLDNDFTEEIPITGFNVSSDFWKEPASGNIPDDKPCGRLTIIELPQGEYEFYYLHGKKGYYRRWWRQRVSNPFKVIAGKAVYLGNIHIRIQSKGKWTTKQYHARGTISDMRARDLPLLYQKYPNITPDKVIFNILPRYDQSVAMQNVNKGVDFAAKGKFNEAKEEFEKALKTAPFYAKRGLQIIDDVENKKNSQDSYSLLQGDKLLYQRFMG